MELTGDLQIAAPRARVWQALNDPDILARCIPGCEELKQISPDETHARVMLKMGPVRARFNGKILMTEVRPNEGCVLNFEGSGGPAGFARGSSIVNLEDLGDRTRLTYSSKANVGGKLGQIGGRMIDISARQMADQFFGALQAQLGAVQPAQGPEEQSLPAEDAPEVPARPAASAEAVPAEPPTQVVRPAAALPAPARQAPLGEGVRALWFALGAAATGFGFWLAHLFAK